MRVAYKNYELQFIAYPLMFANGLIVAYTLTFKHDKTHKDNEQRIFLLVNPHFFQVK